MTTNSGTAAKARPKRIGIAADCGHLHRIQAEARTIASARLAGAASEAGSATSAPEGQAESDEAMDAWRNEGDPN